ncbi:UNVERIFIED_CONTAM: hypothetical protein HHA_315910 [Hammondia hammondi]|eukprot:XP_008883362.1 hypothetical protein HHA_315910 [Hammondia hammondi]
MSSQTSRGVALAKRAKPQSVESRRLLPSVRASPFGDFEENPSRTAAGDAFLLCNEKRSLRCLQSLFCLVALTTLVLNLSVDVTASPAPHPPPSRPSVQQKISPMDAMKMELMSTVTGRLSVRWRRHWLPTVDAHANDPLELRLSLLETLTTELNEDLNAVLANFPEITTRKSVTYFISQCRDLFVFCFRMRLGITGENGVVPVGPFASIAFGEPDQLAGVDRWPVTDAEPFADEKEQGRKSASEGHTVEEEPQKTSAPENVQTPEHLPRAAPVDTESEANVETESDAEDGNDSPDQTEGGMQVNLELVTDGDTERAAVVSLAQVTEALREADKVFEEWDNKDTDAQSTDAVQEEAEKVLNEVDVVLTQTDETGTANTEQEVEEMLQHTEVQETHEVPEKEAESSGLADEESPVTAEFQEADKVMQEVEEVLGKMKTLEMEDEEEATQVAELQDGQEEETSQGDEDDEEEDDDDGEADEEDGDEDEEGAQEADSA